MVLQDLNSNGLLGQFQTFFQQFFGTNGLVDLGNVSSFGIPIGLERIVEFIRKNLEKEVAVKCPSCHMNVTVIVPPPLQPNNTNGTNQTNGTNGTNGTVVPPPLGGAGGSGSGSTPPPIIVPPPIVVPPTTCVGLAGEANVFNVTSYVLPAGCVYSVDRIGEVCCSNSLNSGCFTFNNLNTFMCAKLSTFCQQAEQIYMQCNQNSLCYVVSIYNYLINQSLKDIYVWLSFDMKNVDALFGKCLAAYGDSFTLHKTDFENGFSFDYGH